MDHIMDWHLIYRSGDELNRLRPEQAGAEDGIVSGDATGVNLLYTLRKRELG